jgi:hypothetical protein
MFPTNSRIFLVPFLASFLSVTSCGTSDAPGGNETSSEVPLKLLSTEASDDVPGDDQARNFLFGQPADKISCPGDFFYNDKIKLCATSSQALGPFPKGMIQACKDWGGGEACNATVWSLKMAISARGNGACPRGAYKSSKGLCTDGSDAYGPFFQSHIANCRSKGGGNACGTLKWTNAFAEWSLPASLRDVTQDRFTSHFPALPNLIT